MKVSALLKVLKKDGWKIDRVRGSHRQPKHLRKTGTVTVTVAGKLSVEIPPGTLNAILKQAGLK